MRGGRRHDIRPAFRLVHAEEPRFDADVELSTPALAFDPERTAFLLAAGDKSGGRKKRFHRALFAKAYKRDPAHLDRLSAARQEKKSWAVG